MQLCLKVNTDLYSLKTSKVTLFPVKYFLNDIWWGDTLSSAKSIPNDSPTGLWCAAPVTEFGP